MPDSLPEERLEKGTNKLVSIYGKGKVCGEAFAQGCKRIRAAFSKLPDGWYSVLDEMLDVEGFTDKRFKDAVFNLIKCCKYPEPTIAEIIGFDHSFKLYTYYEMLEYCQAKGLKQKDLFELHNTPGAIKDDEGRYYWKLK